MAENQDGQEKSEQPTAKRVEDARGKGQIPRSRELNSAAITLLGGMALVMMSHPLGLGLWKIMHDNLALARADLFDTTAMLRHLVDSVRDAALMLLPFFALMAGIALLASVVLGGFSVSVQAIAPKFSKISPWSGIKRLLSIKSLVELAKTLAKFLLVGGVGTLLLWDSLGRLIGLGDMALATAVDSMHGVVGWSFVLLASTLLLVAAVDVPFQLWDHRRQLRMTKQEVKEERKNTDGNPEVKARIRGLQRQMAYNRMLEEVPKADVIVTNPTHYAVALRYDQSRMQAPQLVAKGSESIAARIRELGQGSGVPVVESPVLARAIYFNTELGDAIPAGLYLAVARLLAYVFQLRVYRTDGGEQPQQPAIEVPEEFQDGHAAGGRGPTDRAS